MNEAIQALLEQWAAPIITKAVTEAIAKAGTLEAKAAPWKILYTEKEAAEMLSLASHQLRDCRRRQSLS